MKNKFFRLVVRIGVLVLAVSTGALAQAPKHMIFRGLISDYTPQTINGQPVGTWEMRGVWSLKVNGWDGKADFSAALAMVHSDLGVTGGKSELFPWRAARIPTTSRWSMPQVTPLANGFRVSGPAIVTGNGAFPAPFGPNSSLQIDITGGNTIAYSNIQLTFTGDAVKHFGSQPINGVVRRFD